jgi:tetratricopeptide (TPR) repeat protein
MKPAIAIQPSRSQKWGSIIMQALRRQLHRLMLLVCISLALPIAGLAQATAPAALPPEAQAAVDKGVLAAKEQGYLLAIRYFQDARKIAPQTPEIFYDLAVTESKLPGRELRAIAWFGAYLAADPNAPNAVAVKREIERLEVKSQISLSLLIKTVQDAADKISGDRREHNFRDVAFLWAEAGDITSALKIVPKFQDRGLYPLGAIAEAQVEAGDFAGAQRTADLIRDEHDKAVEQLDMAKHQVNAGRLASAHSLFEAALQAAALVKDPSSRTQIQGNIADAQAYAGDIASAQKTADLIQDAVLKSAIEKHIAIAQKRPHMEHIVRVEQWVRQLDDNLDRGCCALNTDPFLDLAGYLKSLPPSDNPQEVFDAFYITAYNIGGTQTVIDQMLKRKSGK